MTALLFRLAVLAWFARSWLACIDYGYDHLGSLLEAAVVGHAILAACAVGCVIIRDVNRARSHRSAAWTVLVYHSIACAVLAFGAAHGAVGEPFHPSLAFVAYLVAALIGHGCIVAALTRGILCQPLRPPPPIPGARTVRRTGQ